MRSIHLLLLAVTSLITITGCVATANLSNYPLSTQSIDFDKIARSEKKEQDAQWNKKTNFEYYLVTENTSTEEMGRIVNRVLKDEQFKIKFNDGGNGVVLAERGLRANEWKTAIGVYYKKSDTAAVQLYIRCQITQDVTGGWREDRAEIIGKRICTLLGGCRNAYPVRTLE